MEWRPIETAPKDGEAVLVAMSQSDGEQQVSLCSFEREWWFPGMSGTLAEFGWTPTHWMPLPAPPATA